MTTSNPTVTDSLLAGLVEQFARIADALERMAPAQATPPPPDYERSIGEFATFDWASINANVIETDEYGVAVVEYKGKAYKRRSPDNKYGAVIFFSRAFKDENDAITYERLITFKEFTPAEPISRKAEASAATHKPAPVAPAQQQPAPTAPAKANGNGKPAATSEEPPAWPDSTVSDAEFENMPSAAEEPAQAAALAQAASQPQTPFQEAAAVLGEIERLTATKMQRFPGTAKPETYAILKDEVKRLVEGKEAQVQVLAYLLAAQAASVIKPDWLPNGARCAAVMDHLTAKDENGKPVMPLHVATGRVRDLKAILALATEQPKF